MIYNLCVLVGILAAVNGKIYFKEDFNDAAWEKRWVVPSDWKAETDMGKWKQTSGEFAGVEGDTGIQTSEDARFYGLSAKMDSEFTNENKDLVVQMTVKHDQDLDCGGAYIKLMGETDQTKFGGDSPYQIMFGPDICGPSNKKTHVIFNYPPKADNLLITNQVKVESDKLTHLYTLHVKTDNTFDVYIDNVSVKSGSLEENWDFLVAKEIKDPERSKPTDWVDKKKITDPEDTKPEGYDDISAEIPDSEAEKPGDWDNEEDGEWEPPMIDNPDYKGPWKANMIANPEYKGEWEHPMIPNPSYAEDKALYKRCDKCSHVGFELWQVKSGTIFDDIIVTDSLEEAQEYAAATFGKKQGPEKALSEAADTKKAEEAKAAAPDMGDMDEEMEEEDHDEL